MNYGMVQPQEGGIGGGVGPSPDGPARVTFYVSVPDLHAALDKIGQLGGTTGDTSDGCARRPDDRLLQ